VGVALNRDGTALAASLHDGDVRFGGSTRLGPALPRGGASTPLTLDLALSSDGRTLAAGREDGTVALWDAGTRKLLSTFRVDKQEVLSVAFAPDGKVLATAAGGNSVKLWDVGEHASTGEPLQGRAPLRAVRFSPDGRLAAAGTENGAVVLFDVASREPLGDPLAGHAGVVYAVAFASGGARLASAGGDGRVLLWDIRPWADEDVLRERACALAGRNLTRSEWERFLPGKAYRRTCDQWPAGT
jgi:WD40 repeat protein